MNKEELKYHIAEEIASGKELLGNLKKNEMSRSDLMEEFRAWENCVKTLLLTNFPNTNTALIKEVIKISLPEFWSNFQDQAILVMEKKLSCLNSIYKYTPDSMTENKKEEELPYKIFISHSSEDENFVKALVDLLEFLGADSKDKLLCSSVTGYRIPVGENICDYIRKQFDEYKLFVLIIHSDSYYESPYSLNEMGAAWVLKSNIYSFLVSGFTFDKMKGVVKDAQIAIKVDSEDAKERLDELQNMLIPIFKPQGVVPSRWEEKRDEFLKKVNG